MRLNRLRPEVLDPQVSAIFQRKATFNNPAFTLGWYDAIFQEMDLADTLL